MTYRITDANCEDMGLQINVAKQSDILRTLRDLGQGWISEDGGHSIRHHEMFSEIYQGGRVIMVADWIGEEQMTKKMIDDMAETALEQIADGEDERTAVDNAVGGILDEHHDDYAATYEAVADIVNAR